MGRRNAANRPISTDAEGVLRATNARRNNQIRPEWESPARLPPQNLPFRGPFRPFSEMWPRRVRRSRLWRRDGPRGTIGCLVVSGISTRFKIDLLNVDTFKPRDAPDTLVDAYNASFIFREDFLTLKGFYPRVRHNDIADRPPPLFEPRLTTT